MKKKKVLVVDDEESFRDLVKRQLEKHNYELLEASSYYEAIKFTDKCDFIILDLKLGEPDGLELLKKIREEKNFVPVIMVSGYRIENEEIKRLEELGILYFLHKPIRITKLTEYIDKAVNINAQIDKIEFSSNRLDSWLRRQEQKFGIQLIPA